LVEFPLNRAVEAVFGPERCLVLGVPAVEFIGLSQQNHLKAAKTLEETEELLRAGFEYVTERDGVKIYRKRK